MTIVFDRLLGELRFVLPSDGVIIDERARIALARTCLPFRNVPALVVSPTSAQQVSEVVRIAVAHGAPLWPVSTGKNWGYGEKVACYEGGITMVLERMTQIVHVDEELGYAVIEPGVTYQQLNEHLKKTGSRLWADCAGTTPHASVIGNALDKGRGLTPYADHFGHICGMDVVLPDGTLLETGGGPAGNNKVRHLYKWGVGPHLDGLFGQSNLGIVVRAGVWLMPAPERFDWGAFEYTAGQETFGAFIDDMRELVFRGALRSFPHFANDFAMMCIVAQYPYDLLDGAKRLSDEAMAAWRKRHGVARWTFGCGVYGSREEVSFQKRTLKKVLRKYGRLQFLGAAVQDNWYGRAVRRVAPMVNRMMGKSDAFMEALLPAINLYKGIPTEHFVRQVYFKSHREKPTGDVDPARDQCGFIWIGPIVPFTSRHVVGALALAKEINDRHEFDFFVEVVVESARSVVILLGVFYERNDVDDAARASAWYHETRDAFLAAGYPPYRTTTMSMPGSADINPAFRDFLASIKRAVDPENLIAPGRYGFPMREPEVERDK